MGFSDGREFMLSHAHRHSSSELASPRAGQGGSHKTRTEPRDASRVCTVRLSGHREACVKKSVGRSSTDSAASVSCHAQPRLLGHAAWPPKGLRFTHRSGAFGLKVSLRSILLPSQPPVMCYRHDQEKTYLEEVTLCTLGSGVKFPMTEPLA